MNLEASVVFEKNWEALQQGYKILENVGSSRSTKTWSFFQIIYLYSLQNKRKRTVVMRDTAVACRELVESEFKDWMQDPCGRIKQFEKGEITGDQLDKYLESENLMNHVLENKTKHSYTFLESGSVISFNGADNISKIIGKGNDLVWINEPYDFPEEVMLQLLKRVRIALLLDWNPNKDHYIEKFRSRPDCIHIHSTFMDNPFLEDSVRNEILGNKPLDNDYFDFPVEHYIDWKRSEIEKDLQNHPQKVIDDVLLCYDNEQFKTANKYHWEVYGLGRKSEKPNRIFHFTEISDKEWFDLDSRIVYGVDWGAVDPMGVIAVKYYDGCLYVKELSYLSENKLKEKLTSQERNQIEQSDEGFITWYFNRLGMDKTRPVICDNNRESKIRALRRIGFDYAIAASKPKGSIIDGIDTINNLKVYYTSTSLNVKHEQENYSRKLDRNGVVLEEPEDKDNHTLDPLRYVTLFLQKEGVINKF